MKFAFIILGDFEASADRAVIHGGTAQILGVSNMEEACAAAQKLQQQEIGCIELCGAFGKEGAKKLIQATQNKIPVGYVTHLPEQEEIYRRVFAKKE